MTLTVIRADARSLPIPDDSVDLVVTSPPYFGLRSYQDGGKHYEGQVGAEATPAEFVDALIEVTRECVRVLKPTGSMWVNLGDKYASTSTPGPQSQQSTMTGGRHKGVDHVLPRRLTPGAPPKSLIGIPWRYALRCIDDLGLILRAEVIWAKPNGLPESVTDRVRRSHEQWFHFTLEPRYFSAVDEIREAHARIDAPRQLGTSNRTQRHETAVDNTGWKQHEVAHNPLGKLPGSVWQIPTEPLRVPEHLGVDHFAAFPSEFPKRIIAGWSPGGVCVDCGEGRRPVVDRERRANLTGLSSHRGPGAVGKNAASSAQAGAWTSDGYSDVSITGYTCACEQTYTKSGIEAPTTPAVVLDPFGGTGTTAHVAHALGRHGISVDLSADYCRLASAPELIDQRVRKVLGVEKARPEVTGQADLFGGDAA